MRCDWLRGVPTGMPPEAGDQGLFDLCQGLSKVGIPIEAKAGLVLAMLTLSGCSQVDVGEQVTYDPEANSFLLSPSVIDKVRQCDPSVTNEPTVLVPPGFPGSRFVRGSKQWFLEMSIKPKGLNEIDGGGDLVLATVECQMQQLGYTKEEIIKTQANTQYRNTTLSTQVQVTLPIEVASDLEGQYQGALARLRVALAAGSIGSIGRRVARRIKRKAEGDETRLSTGLDSCMRPLLSLGKIGAEVVVSTVGGWWWTVGIVGTEIGTAIISLRNAVTRRNETDSETRVEQYARELEKAYTSKVHYQKEPNFDLEDVRILYQWKTSGDPVKYRRAMWVEHKLNRGHERLTKELLNRAENVN